MYEIIINLEFTSWLNEYTDRLESFIYDIKVRLIAETKEIAKKEVERLRSLSANQLKDELTRAHDALTHAYDDLTSIDIYYQELTVNFQN